MTAGTDCWKCGNAVGAALACPRCAAVQAVPPGTDLFAVLGLPRRLALDPAALEAGYLDASRVVHPDRHQTATARERELSLTASAAVNRAYRTLRDPVARGRYWLELHGRRLADSSPHVPAAIAAEVFETQEKLEELRTAAGPERPALQREVEALRDGFEGRLAALRDALTTLYAERDGEPSLDDLRERLAEIAYLNTLLGDIDQTIGEGFRATDRRH